jgi:hypothetical protein
LDEIIQSAAWQPRIKKIAGIGAPAGIVGRVRRLAGRRRGGRAGGAICGHVLPTIRGYKQPPPPNA